MTKYTLILRVCCILVPRTKKDSDENGENIGTSARAMNMDRSDVAKYGVPPVALHLDRRPSTSLLYGRKRAPYVSLFTLSKLVITIVMHFSKTYSQLLEALPPELRDNAIQYRQVRLSSI